MLLPRGAEAPPCKALLSAGMARLFSTAPHFLSSFRDKLLRECCPPAVLKSGKLQLGQCQALSWRCGCPNFCFGDVLRFGLWLHYCIQCMAAASKFLFFPLLLPVSPLSTSNVEVVEVVDRCPVSTVQDQILAFPPESSGMPRKLSDLSESQLFNFFFNSFNCKIEIIMVIAIW